MTEPAETTGKVSPPAEPALEAAYLRVARAEEHLNELSQLEQGLAKGMGMLQILPRSETREQLPDGRWQFTSPVIELPELPAPDPKWSILVGESVYNLRAALDYLVYALAHLDSGSPQERTQFPIFQKSEHFKANSRGYLKGVSQDHSKAIEALQPFAGEEPGSDWLARLAELSNPDKHRHLVATVVANELQAELEAQKQPDSVRISGRILLSPGPVIVFDEESNTPVVDLLRSLAGRVKQTLDQFAPDFGVAKE